MEQTNTESSLFDLSINETAKDHLRKIASWSLVIVACAVIGYILSIVRALQPASPVTTVEGFGGSVTAGRGLGSVIFGIIIGLFINYFLFQFANLTRKGVNGMNQASVNGGFYHLKIYFIILGILVIIGFLFGLLAVLALNTGTVSH